MVRRDYHFLCHYFRQQLNDPNNNRDTVINMILNFAVASFAQASNFNPVIFWNKATGMPIPSTFTELFPGLDIEKATNQLNQQS